MLQSPTTKKATSGRPHYQRIANVLRDKIMNGLIPVGTVLPAEDELAEYFSVSRGTIRKSLDLLEDDRLISRQRRNGTKVITRFPTRGLVEKVRILDDWAQYSIDYPLKISSIYRQEDPQEIQEHLGMEIDGKWLCVVGQRYPPGINVPISYCQAFISPIYSDIEDEVYRLSPPVFSLVEQKFGAIIKIIKTEMRGVIIRGVTAEILAVEPGSAGFQMLRTFLTADRSIVEFSINTHPADRFTYAVEIQREDYV